MSLRGVGLRVSPLVGLAALALALAALATASSAQAEPEFGVCRALTKNTTPKAKHGKYADANCLNLYEKKAKIEAKGPYEWEPGRPKECLPMKHGNYIDAGCTTLSAKPGKGFYEKQPKPTYHGFLPAKAVLHLGARRTIECATGSESGEILTGQTYSATMEFGLCEEAAKPCTSAGKPPGVIGTLSTTAGLEEKPGPKIYSGLPIREVVGGAFGPIECPPSNPLEITPVAALGAGGAFGVNTGNVNVSTKFGTLNFAPLPAGAEQYWEAYEKLGPSAFTPLGEVALKAEFANEFALAVEIKS